jgi:hypothetical protein
MITSLDVAETQRSTHIKRMFPLKPFQARGVRPWRNRCFLNRGTGSVARYKAELLSDHLVCIRDLIEPRDFRINNDDEDEHIRLHGSDRDR